MLNFIEFQSTMTTADDHHHHLPITTTKQTSSPTIHRQNAPPSIVIESTTSDDDTIQTCSIDHIDDPLVVPTTKKQNAHAVVQFANADRLVTRRTISVKSSISELNTSTMVL